MRFIGFGFINPEGWKKEMMMRSMSKKPKILKKMLERRGIKIEPDVEGLIDFYPIAYDAAKRSNDGGITILELSPNSVAVGALSNIKNSLEPNYLLNLSKSNQKDFSIANLVARKMIEKGISNYDIGETIPGTMQTLNLDPRRFGRKVKSEIQKLSNI